MKTAKQFIISKHLVMHAFKLIKENAGGAGVDGQSIAEFELNLQDNLYKLWNRMSSGSYFPPSVKAVAIPKKSGGERILGIPTVADRVAQMVVKQKLEAAVEPIFLADSYGYRPGKSALDAVAVTRKRCWQYNWVLEFDIKGLFDNIDHELLLKAVRKHTTCKWTLLYIERWLKASMMFKDGSIVPRTAGTPQGGVISPLLANIFLHYAFDVWISRHYPRLEWCRYADDALVHCQTEMQAHDLKAALAKRLMVCKLELHPTKTKIVYCKDIFRKKQYPVTSFDFLGFCFRPRKAISQKTNRVFTSFSPAVSSVSTTLFRQKTRSLNLRNRSDLSLNDISKMYNCVIRGWMAYFGKFRPSAMRAALRHFNKTLVAWARHKFKSLKGSPIKAIQFMHKIAAQEPNLFAHWKAGMVGSFA